MKGNLKLSTLRSMLKSILIGILLITGCATSSPMVGKVSPDILLRDQDHRSIKLSDYHGKQSLILVFYNSST